MLDRRQFILSSAATVAASGPAFAQAWPSRQISLVILFAAGSGTDTMARIFAEKLSAQTGQPVVVDNKPGGNGTIAGAFVARAAADGHTLMFTSNTSHAAAPALVKNMPYDPVKDFECVGLIGLVPFVVVANPNAPFNNVKELVAYAKANPGKLSFASGNSTGVVAGETLKRMAGIDVLHVPYKGTPEALNDVMGGRVEYFFSPVVSALSLIRDKRVVALANGSPKRSSVLPDLPTLREQGIDFDLDGWYAIFAPARTPRPVVDKLNKAVVEVLAMPEVKERLAKIGADPSPTTPKEFDELVVRELKENGELVKAAGIKGQ